MMQGAAVVAIGVAVSDGLGEAISSGACAAEDWRELSQAANKDSRRANRSTKCRCFRCKLMLLNVWKPVMVSRFHDHADLESAATTLSIANQSKTLSVAVLAPLMGVVIDGSLVADSVSLQIRSFWPVAALGVLASVFGLALSRGRCSDASARS